MGAGGPAAPAGIPSGRHRGTRSLTVSLTVSITPARPPVDKLAPSHRCSVGSGRAEPCALGHLERTSHGDVLLPDPCTDSSQACGRSWGSRARGVASDLDSPPLGLGAGQCVVFVPRIHLGTTAQVIMANFTAWRMLKAAIPIFVCFLLNLAQKPRPLSFLPTLAPFLATSHPGCFITTWLVDLWPGVSDCYCR